MRCISHSAMWMPGLCTVRLPLVSSLVSRWNRHAGPTQWGNVERTAVRDATRRKSSEASRHLYGQKRLATNCQPNQVTARRGDTASPISSAHAMSASGHLGSMPALGLAERPRCAPHGQTATLVAAHWVLGAALTALISGRDTRGPTPSPET